MDKTNKRFNNKAKVGKTRKLKKKYIEIKYLKEFASYQNIDDLILLIYII